MTAQELVTTCQAAGILLAVAGDGDPRGQPQATLARVPRPRAHPRLAQADVIANPWVVRQHGWILRYDVDAWQLRKRR